MDYLTDEANEETAIRYYQAVRRTLGTLSKQPGLSRMRRDLRPAGIRSWRVDRPFEDWLIFYRITEQGLDIIRVKHGAMDLHALFRN